MNDDIGTEVQKNTIKVLTGRPGVIGLLCVPLFIIFIQACTCYCLLPGRTGVFVGDGQEFNMVTFEPCMVIVQPVVCQFVEHEVRISRPNACMSFSSVFFFF